MINDLLDAILPGDAALGLPPGSRVDFGRYVRDQGIDDDVVAVVTLVEAVALEQGGVPFTALDPDRRLDCVERAKRRDARLVMAVIVHCLKAYYTDPQVLGALPTGSVPPFPDGNVLDDDDWSILEPVYERGPIFRPVSS